MTTKSFTFTHAEKNYPLRLEYTYWNWRFSLYANDFPVLENQRFGFSPKDYPFTLAGRQGFVRKTLSSEDPFDIVLDNTSLVSGKPSYLLTRLPWWGWLPLGISILIVLLGMILLVGGWFIPHENTVPYLAQAWLKKLVNIIGIFALLTGSEYLKERARLPLVGKVLLILLFSLLLIGLELALFSHASHVHAPPLVSTSMDIGLLCLFFGLLASVLIFYLARISNEYLDVRIFACILFAGLSWFIPQLFLGPQTFWVAVPQQPLNLGLFDLVALLLRSL